jgi:hypothetical protein
MMFTLAPPKLWLAEVITAPAPFFIDGQHDTEGVSCFLQYMVPRNDLRGLPVPLPEIKRLVRYRHVSPISVSWIVSESSSIL